MSPSPVSEVCAASTHRVWGRASSPSASTYAWRSLWWHSIVSRLQSFFPGTLFYLRRFVGLSRRRCRHLSLCLGAHAIHRDWPICVGATSRRRKRPSRFRLGAASERAIHARGSSVEKPSLLRRLIFSGNTRRSSKLWAHARGFRPRDHLIFFHGHGQGAAA